MDSPAPPGGSGNPAPSQRRRPDDSELPLGRRLDLEARAGDAAVGKERARALLPAPPSAPTAPTALKARPRTPAWALSQWAGKVAATTCERVLYALIWLCSVALRDSTLQEQLTKRKKDKQSLGLDGLFGARGQTVSTFFF